MSKYYTPEKEEFHPGLEFKVYIDEIKTWIQFTYSRHTYFSEVIKGGWAGDGFTIADKLDLKKIRVRHLDRWDIEILGFNEKAIEWHEADGVEYYGEKIIKDDIIGLSFIPQSNKVHLKRTSGESMWFTIKNKSELKKVLKMIGI